jgi:hypothetical protein
LLIGEILCCICCAYVLIVRLSHCNIHETLYYDVVALVSVPTSNARQNLSRVPCLALKYRLLPTTFLRCQNNAKDVAGVTFSTPNDDEVDESEILEIDKGVNESNCPSISNGNTTATNGNTDDNDDFGDEDDILDEEEEDATTKSSTTRNRGRQKEKRVVSSKRVTLSLRQKVGIIIYYEASKNSTSKPISLTQLGIWAQNRFRDVLSKPPSNGTLCTFLRKQKADILLRHNFVLSDRGKQRKRQRKNIKGNKVCRPFVFQNYVLFVVDAFFGDYRFAG